MNSARFLLPFTAFALIVGCGQEQPAVDQPAAEQPATEETAAPEPVEVEVEVVEIEPGLTMRILKEGDGDVATPGQLVSVHYTGWLFDPEQPQNRGNKFDSSVDRQQAFDFPLGAGRVIKGWDRGVAGMKIGERRELTIAPELAYGDRNISVIPAGSTLVFEVDLLGLTNPPGAGAGTD